MAFPLAEPQRSVWSPGAVAPVPEERERERAGKEAVLPGRGTRQRIKESSVSYGNQPKSLKIYILSCHGKGESYLVLSFGAD